MKTLPNKEKIYEPVQNIDVPATIERDPEKIKKQPKTELAKAGFLVKRFLVWDILLNAQELKKKEPLLFYITEENQIYTYFNVKPGQIQPKDQFGKKKEQIINEIHPRKMLVWNYGGEKIRAYVHYEKERYSYPHEPIEDAKRTTTVLKNIQSNYKNYDDATRLLGNLQLGDIKKWLYLIGGVLAIILGIIYAGKILGIWEMFGWINTVETAKAAAPVVEQNLTDLLSGGRIVG